MDRLTHNAKLIQHSRLKYPYHAHCTRKISPTFFHRDYPEMKFLYAPVPKLIYVWCFINLDDYNTFLNWYRDYSHRAKNNFKGH